MKTHRRAAARRRFRKAEANRLADRRRKGMPGILWWEHVPGLTGMMGWPRGTLTFKPEESTVERDGTGWRRTLSFHYTPVVVQYPMAILIPPGSL